MTAGRISVSADGKLRFEPFPEREHRNGYLTHVPPGWNGELTPDPPPAEWMVRLNGSAPSGAAAQTRLANGAAAHAVAVAEPVVEAPPAPAPEDPADSPEQAREDRRRVGRNLGALASGQVVTWVMTLLWTLVVPRTLGPVGLGLVVSAQSVSGVLTVVLGVGARNYLVREIVVDGDRTAELLRTAILLRLTLAPIVALAAVIWAHAAHYGHDASVVLYVITVMGILTLLAEPLQAAFQATERMKYLAYGDMINKTLQSVVGIAVVVIGFGAIGLAVNMAAAAAVVALYYGLRLRRFFRMDAKTSFRKMGTMAKQSSSYWVAWFFGYFYFWIDAIMLTLMTRSKVVGWYGATTSLFISLSFLPALVGTAWLPRLVASFAHGHRNLVKTARTPIEFIFVISVPVAAGTAMIAGPLVHAIYGPAYAHAVPVMIILAACIPSGYLNIILVQVLVAAKRQAIWSWVMVVAAVINPAMNLVLIPLTESRYHNGAIGAAISLLLTEGLMTVVGFVLVGRHVFDRHAIRRCLLATAASGAMLLVAYATHSVGTLPSLAAGACTLVLLTVALRIPTSDEIALIRSGIARVRRAGGGLLTRNARPAMSQEEA